MDEREALILELWSKLNDVTGNNGTSRNPSTPPNEEDLSHIQFFEMEDRVIASTMRGGFPVHKRELNIVIEGFTTGSSDDAASNAAALFMKQIKRKLYENGAAIMRGVPFKEIEMSRMLRPPTEGITAGLGLVIQVTYHENIGNII